MPSPPWLATLIIAALAGDPALSARLKALLRDVSGGLKVRKQCLRVVCWPPIHHHHHRTPAHWRWGLVKVCEASTAGLKAHNGKIIADSAKS